MASSKKISFFKNCKRNTPHCYYLLCVFTVWLLFFVPQTKNTLIKQQHSKFCVFRWNVHWVIFRRWLAVEQFAVHFIVHFSTVQLILSFVRPINVFFQSWRRMHSELEILGCEHRRKFYRGWPQKQLQKHLLTVRQPHCSIISIDWQSYT